MLATRVESVNQPITSGLIVNTMPARSAAPVRRVPNRTTIESQISPVVAEKLAALIEVLKVLSRMPPSPATAAENANTSTRAEVSDTPTDVAAGGAVRTATMARHDATAVG